MRIYTLIVVLFLCTISMKSQSEVVIDISFNNTPLKEALNTISETYNVVFSYQDSFVEDKKVTLKKGERSLLETLSEVFEKTDLDFQILKNRYVLLTKESSKESKVHKLEGILIGTYLARGISKNLDATYKISPSKLEILPGLTEPDVLESIQLLPGVISPNETATGLLVRGGVADQNRIIWDGINVYHRGHLFGMISPFNPNVTHEVTFINKGTLPSYGERVSSVIDISSKTNIENEWKAELGVNGISVDGLLDIPVIKDKLSVVASVRRSYEETLHTITLEQLAKKTFQSTKISDVDVNDNEFSFLDYNVKLNFHPNANNRFYASFISIENRLNYRTRDDQNSFNDLLVSSNEGYGLGWTHDWSNKVSQKTNAFFSKYNLDYNFITINAQDELTDFIKQNVIFDSGISTEVNWDVSKKTNLLFGYQYVLKDVGFAFENITPSFSFLLDSEKRVLQSHSFYGNYKFKDFKLFDVSVGARGTYFTELHE